MAGFAEDKGLLARDLYSFCNGSLYGHSFVFVVLFARPLVGDPLAPCCAGF